MMLIIEIFAIFFFYIDEEVKELIFVLRKPVKIIRVLIILLV